MKETLTVGLAQIAPVWFNREKTIDKVIQYMKEGALKGAELLVFGEALIPGYPFWLDKLGGSAFNSKVHKQIHAKYMAQAVDIDSGQLTSICEKARELKMAVYLGIVERPIDRGGHSLYCSLIFIDRKGKIKSVHRKLMPTYEERLAWSPGDGNGLVTHKIPPFTVGGLNCWENWMPLARTALYAQGEDLHISVWPGNKRNTEMLLPVIAQESRSYVIGVSGIFRPTDISDDFPFAEEMIEASSEILADGGSCLAAPDGSWVIPPCTNEEALLVSTINHEMVREERQNFDPSGHYSRPDVLKLQLNSGRQKTIE